MFARNGRLLALLLSTTVICSLPVRAQPIDPPRITSLTQTEAGWSLGWESPASDTAFTVLFQDTLQDGIWRIPASATLFPTATNQWTDSSNTNATRFYGVISVPAAERGKLLSTQLNGTITTNDLASIFQLVGVPITPQYDVIAYKLDYETITPWGARTLASGALMLPLNTGRLLPLVSYQHGTITQTNLAPSGMELTLEVGVGLALATSGYAAALPDYLGLGDSPGLHPFHHARSEATACVDFLRAVRTFCSANGFPLSDRLFLTGYSQGGHATMALLRELETYHTNEFTVTACAPMAGAYDLSGVTASNFLASVPTPNPYYFLYLLAAYQDVYHLAPSLADMLTPPYDTTLPPLMNGNTSGDDINKAMPADPLQILKPSYLAAFRANPRHPLWLALADNDVYRWRPRSPLHMYHCAGDQDVIIANSEVAYATFQALGATQVELVDPDPSADHGGCAEPSMLSAKEWFDSLR